MKRVAMVVSALLWVACNEATLPTGAGGAGGSPAPDFVAPCADELRYFEQNVWQPTLAVVCIGCHNEAGPAKESRMVLWPDTRAGYLEHNFQQVFNVATVGTQEHPLFLMMPSNTNPERQHPGGELFKTDSVTYASLRGLVDRVWTPGCDGDAPPLDCSQPTPGPRLLRRLTPIEYDNTIEDLLGVDSDWGATFPADAVVDNFRNHAKSLMVTPLLADKLQVAAEALAQQADLTRWLSCDVANGNADCARGFVGALGEQAFRRPLSDADVDRYVTLHTSAAGFEAGCRLVLTAMLQSPHFLYRPELGTAQSDGSYVLDDFEIASELSYLVWQSMPDAMLLEAARSDMLHTQQQVDAQVTRMLAMPRARTMLRHFIVEWLGLNAVITVPRDAQAFPSLTQAVRDALLQEAERVIERVAFDDNGTLMDLLTTSRTSLDAQLATHYGLDIRALTPGADGTVTVDMAAQDRSGLLTSGAAMLTHARSNASSPVHRGRFVRERLLCQVPPPPPPGLNVQPPAVDPSLTARERYAAHSVMEPCRSCHQLMDPIGFSFEHFDGIGRYRSDDNGLPIDVRGEILRSQNTNATFEGTTELAGLLADSSDVAHCFAQQAFRFGYGISDSNDVRCAVDAVNEELRASQYSLSSFVRALTRGVHFNKRRSIHDAPITTDAGMPDATASDATTSDGGVTFPDATTQDTGTPATDITAERVQNNDWGAGYCHTYQLTNDTAAAVTWSLTLPIDGTISHSWETTRTGDGGEVTFSGVDYNSTLQPGGTTQFGFCAER